MQKNVVKAFGFTTFVDPLVRPMKGVFYLTLVTSFSFYNLHSRPVIFDRAISLQVVFVAAAEKIGWSTLESNGQSIFTYTKQAGTSAGPNYTLETQFYAEGSEEPVTSIEEGVSSDVVMTRLRDHLAEQRRQAEALYGPGCV